jgi:hypothetical protein
MTESIELAESIGHSDDLATAYLNLLSGPARINAWGLAEEPIDVDAFVCARVKLFLHGVLPGRGG